MRRHLGKVLPLLIFVAVLLLSQHWWRIELALNPIATTPINAADVILYSTSWCPYCSKARAYLQQAKVPFTEYDIEKNPRAYAMYERISGRGVPVLTIGANIIQGYDRAAIERALRTMTTAAAKTTTADAPVGPVVK